MEDNNIRFEPMPDFSSNPSTEEREYSTLFDELEDKCNPDRFMKPFVQQHFDLANELYAELQKRVKRDDNSLKDIRDKAIDGLGIHISTGRLYKYLLEYCDPKIYTAMKPYDKERVQEAGRLFAKIQEAKDDIHALEAVEKEAESFISQRKNELQQQTMQELAEANRQRERIMEAAKKENRRIAIFMWTSFIVLCIFIIIAAAAGLL